ncbi:MAG: GNAT family N-acetyltransferase [Planctomycetota bacterium]|nr:GNAT family N-acetyltransferase [Planctomycetota bacterium]
MSPLTVNDLVLSLMPIDFSPYRLTPFSPIHRDALIGLIARCYLEYGQVIELDTLDADLLDIESNYRPPENTFQLLLDMDRVIGSVALQQKTPGLPELKRVFLDPEYRGRGLGKKLSRWAFEHAATRGATTLDIWSDTLFETAHHLYRGLGAKETGLTRSLGGRNEVSEQHFQMDLSA